MHVDNKFMKANCLWEMKDEMEQEPIRLWIRCWASSEEAMNGIKNVWIGALNDVCLVSEP